MCNETKTPSKPAAPMIGSSLQQPADRWSDATMTGCGNNHVGRARSCGFTASCPPLRADVAQSIISYSVAPSGYAVTRCCGGWMLGCISTVGLYGIMLYYYYPLCCRYTTGYRWDKYQWFKMNKKKNLKREISPNSPMSGYFVRSAQRQRADKEM